MRKPFYCNDRAASSPLNASLQARTRFAATRAIITGFRRLIAGRRDREFLRKTLAVSHRRAAEELHRAGRDAEVADAVSREERRISKAEEEIEAAESCVRRAWMKGWETGWLGLRRSQEIKELRQETRRVKEEWRVRRCREADDSLASMGAGAIPASSMLGALGILMPGSTREKGNQGPGSGRGTEGAAGKRSKNGALESDANGVATLSGGFSQHCKVSTNATPHTVSDTEREEIVDPALQVGAPQHHAAAECEARRRILRRELALVHDTVRHNYDARNPPPLKCCAPDCGRTFTHDAHYLAHWGAGISHTSLSPEEKPVCDRNGLRKMEHGAHGAMDSSKLSRSAQLPESQPGTGHPTLGGEEIASFHLTIASSKCEGGDPSASGFQLVAAYILRVWGLGEVYHTLEFWRAVESWRCYQTTTPEYIRGAQMLRKMYFDANALRKTGLHPDTQARLCAILRALPHVEFDGKKEAKRSDEISEQSHGKRSSDVRIDEVVRRTQSAQAPSPASRTPMTAKFRAPYEDRGAPPPTTEGHQIAKIRRDHRDAAASKKMLSAAEVVAATSPARKLRPTLFDQAQWQALAYLCRVVGPGFWASDLGQRHAVLREKARTKSREDALEMARIEVSYEVNENVSVMIRNGPCRILAWMPSHALV